LIDPEVADAVIAEARDHSAECDYASNIIVRTYPRGLDVEAVFREPLERVERSARSAPAREHVTYHILNERPDQFRIRSSVHSSDNSDLRWTVDTPEDLEFARRLYSEMGLTERLASYPEVLSYVRSHPQLMKLNAHIAQKVY
jgi:spore coat polysaccharide biosynthesis protein SpsF